MFTEEKEEELYRYLHTTINKYILELNIKRRERERNKSENISMSMQQKQRTEHGVFFFYLAEV